MGTGVVSSMDNAFRRRTVRIPEYPPLIILQEKIAVFPAFNVIGQQGNLPSAPRRIDDVGRYGIAGGEASQPSDDFQTL
jgi:hypothetical protein